MFQKNELIDLLQKDNTLGESISNRAHLIPDHPAIIYQNRDISYRQLNEKIDALATAFLKMGICPGDRIAVILPTRPEFLYVWYAASKIGAAVVGLNVRYRQEEITYMINNVKPSVLVCINKFGGTDYGDFLKSLLSNPSLKKFIFLGQTSFPDALDLEELLKENIDTKALRERAAQIKPEDDNFIIYTSGTTGRPKGAVLTQKSILAMMRPWAKNMGLNEKDRMFCVLPLNHVGGGTILALSTLASGATLVMMDTFVPDKALALIKDLRCQAFGAVPTIYAIFFSLPIFQKEMLSSLRLAIYGGAAASPDLLRQMKENIPNAVIMACYGATEVSGFCTYTTPDDPEEKIMNTVGRAPKGIDLKIVDPVTRKELSVREVGEVAVKGDLVFDRYLDMEEETDKAKDKEGWYYTGDMGYLDEEGYLTLVGRYKEMYISGGYNVYPKEIEDILMQHPAVAMVAVIGIPDKIKGETGWAFVMKKPDQETNEEDLKAYCQAKMADYKVPSRIFIEKELPMTALGKIDKMRLKESILNKIETTAR
ncbi:MAG: acyl--CoA ligase [Syntrophales bacterium]|nr:acyl--CoA ligase [Syntrophales bacterium]